jgi:hypothetical protein
MDEHFVNAVIEGGAPAKALVTDQRQSKGQNGEDETHVDLWVFPSRANNGAGRVLTGVPLLDKPGANGEAPETLGDRVNYAYPWETAPAKASTSKTTR